jgi:YegS/Rv2252/BmrU family lipid kinase
MQRVALIYNPISGQHSTARKHLLERVLAVLRGAGLTVTPFETDGPGSGPELAQQAVREGYDTVLACGGDGTMHAVLQGLAGTQTALGVIPFGTANALAAALGLAGSPVRAAKKLLSAEPVRIPAGRIFYHDEAGQEQSRYFLVAAGIGPDALLMASMDAGLKRRLGYLLYLIQGFRIWARGDFPMFAALFGKDRPYTRRVSQLLVIRVRSLGGAVGALVPGASLHSDSLRMLAFATQSRWQYLKFVSGAVLGRHRFSRIVDLFETSHAACATPDDPHTRLLAEADGEVLGRPPIRMEVVPDTVTLLVPPGKKI